MTDPLGRRETEVPFSAQLAEAAAWVGDLLFERTEVATGVDEPVVEARALRLAKGRRIACVSLVAGCGTSTLAALLAQRAGGAGSRVRLVDLDLVAPTLALLAGQRAPTVSDALLSEQVRGRRWGSVEVLFGVEHDLGPDAGGALAELVRRLAGEAAVVIDAGVLAAPGCERILRAADTVLYVTSPRAAHVHAAVRASSLLASLAIEARLVVTRADASAGAAIAREVDLPLVWAIPEDPFLLRDEFRVRLETARAIDRLAAQLS